MMGPITPPLVTRRAIVPMSVMMPVSKRTARLTIIGRKKLDGSKNLLESAVI
jgi:hypothetical protein